MILGRHLQLREALPGDAEFTYRLRNDDPRELLDPLKGTVADQQRYIVNSRANPDETLWIISQAQDSKPIGMVRWTHLNDSDKMGWESLLIHHDAPPAVGIDIMVTTYAYCFRVLQRSVLGPWRVPVWNTQMHTMHERMGFARIVEDDSGMVWYAVDKPTFDEQWLKWRARGFGAMR